MQNEAKLDSLLQLVDSMKDGVPIDEVRIADSRDGTFYRHDDRTRLALKVALITARPLLLVGPPGCGKSSLAPYVARNLRLRSLSYTVTETAEVGDLFWRIDYLRRLNDAQIHQLKPIKEYIEEGILWRAFMPSVSKDGSETSLGTLILIDEIDKANAGFANSLLVALGSLQFDVPYLENETIKADREEIILVMMTSNEERELPPALTRRCVTLRVNYPTAGELVQITQDRWPMWMENQQFRDSVISVAESLTSGDAGASRVSTAEFLDLVQVLKMSGVSPSGEIWHMIEGLVLLRSEEGDV